MKKLFVLAALLTLPACACMNSDEPEVTETKVVYRSLQPAPRTDCDAVDGNTCYRYVRTPRYTAPTPVVQYQQPAPVVPYQQPTPVYNYVEPTPAPAPMPTACNGCEPTYSATREPVEVVYKKTTYKTVYEPKTTSSVSYEKEPYNGQVAVQNTPPAPRITVPARRSYSTPVAQPLIMDETEVMTLDDIK